MKPFTNLLFVMCIYHHCIGEDASWYKLLNGAIADVGKRCTNEWNGNITIFRDYSSDRLNQILDENVGIRIWNGYKYTSDLMENNGCFKRTWPLNGYREVLTDMTISYCEHFCKEFGEFDIAIKESECTCLSKEWKNSILFSKVDAQYCKNKCNVRPEEHCGSNSKFYNIYSARIPKSFGYPDITDNGLCVLYHWKNSEEKLEAENCDTKLTSGIIACRRSIGNSPILFNVTTVTWRESLDACLQHFRSKSYLVSYFDTRNISDRNGIIWLNERKYTTTVEKMHVNKQEKLEICEVLSREHNGNVLQHLQNCSNDHGVIYICKTGNIGDKFSTPTVPYRQNTTLTPRISPTSQEEISTSNIDDKFSTSTVPYQQKTTSTSRISPTTQTEKSNSDVSNVFSTSTVPHQHNVSANSRISQDGHEENGSLIGGVIGALVLVAVIGGLVFVFVIRMRRTGSCKEESQYQPQNVQFSKSNGIANMAYCSEATFDIIQGNPDRNSQENYMTIKDEDLQSLRNAKSEANKSADQNNSSPSDGPLYMVLEDAKSLSEVAASFPNYELAKPISNNESSDKENCEHNEENVEYDHLRQDAYKQAQEDASPLADIADEYSHISQVTNVIDDNYTHTENYMHTCTTTNEEDDAYAHAQSTGYDHVVSEGDTRNSNPYDLAQNEDNLQNDSTECETDSFVQLDADNGNYSLAKPVDVSDGT